MPKLSVKRAQMDSGQEVFRVPQMRASDSADRRNGNGIQQAPVKDMVLHRPPYDIHQVSAVCKGSAAPAFHILPSRVADDDETAGHHGKAREHVHALW